jgi:Nif11 domain
VNCWRVGLLQLPAGVCGGNVKSLIGSPTMSWSELERLVTTAEADGSLRRALRQSRSQEELVLAARRLGYRITCQVLAAAVEEHRGEDVGVGVDATETGATLQEAHSQQSRL